MLSAFRKNDFYSPEEESQLIVNSSVQGKLLRIPALPAMKSLAGTLEQISDWLEKQLKR